MIELYKLISEVEFKLEALPESYFLEYFEKEFLPRLKEFYKNEINKARK